MFDYSKTAYDLKRSICNFCSRLAQGLPVPFKKFLSCMVFGILASKTVILAEISRSLNEDIKLKKTIERLSRNLEKFSYTDDVLKNLSSEVKRYIHHDTPIIIDLSDIVKKYGVVFENMGKIRDGSTKETNMDGYYLLEALIYNHGDKLLVPIYSDLFSPSEPGFKSENEEIIKCLDKLRSLYGTKGIYTMDRGMDNVLFFNYFENNSQKFVIRLKKNRNVIFKGKEINIVDLVKKYKGKYSTIIKKKNGKQRKIQFGFLPIELPEITGKVFNLVFVRGYARKGLMLLTNLDIKDGKDCLRPILCYISRWNVEEFIRFKKNQYKLEDVRVQSYQRLKNINFLLTMAMSYISLTSKSISSRKMIFILQEISKRVHGIPPFPYYSTADGIYEVLKKHKTGIAEFLNYTKKKPKSQQLSLFELRYCKSLLVS
ncbi:MAG: hypothetical protein PWQ37_2847 [Candidatus Petromonas sp.]|jgi:hypothetical protein|uniref:transposase n=3 Tax=Petroclostridium xylanilyticum TaxID=1792311 RepID=UPI000B98516B|nr:transposase [Petroclostridium xylanilyticum]MDK2920114.1 hypothetical protein [Candidatus Petromonas sp.]